MFRGSLAENEMLVQLYKWEHARNYFCGPFYMSDYNLMDTVILLARQCPLVKDATFLVSLFPENDLTINDAYNVLCRYVSSNSHGSNGGSVKSNANSGHVGLALHFAGCIQRVRGKSKEATILFERAMQHNCGGTFVGFCSKFHSNGDPRPEHKRFENAKRAAELGDCVGMAILSGFYARGIGCVIDDSLSLLWLHRGALAGSVDAAFNYALDAFERRAWKNMLG